MRVKPTYRDYRFVSMFLCNFSSIAILSAALAIQLGMIEAFPSLKLQFFRSQLADRVLHNLSSLKASLHSLVLLLPGSSVAYRFTGLHRP